MKLFHFFQDRKWYEDVAHIFVGMVPFFGWAREWKQWPPGDPDSHPSTGVGVMWTQMDRVADAYRDFLGYAIGDVLRTAVLVGLLIWRW